MNWIFFKELERCFTPAWSLRIILGISFGMGMYYACQVCFASSTALPDYHKTSVVSLTKLNSISKGKADSIIAMYNEVGKLADRVQSLANNYQGDSNLMIEKSDQMVAKWLTISTALVALIIGLSVWNNYKQENAIKERVEKEREKMENIMKELELSTRMNKIASIMTCLNSLPDPLMSASENTRKTYVKRNLEMLYDEFVAYKNMIIEYKMDDQNLNYVQLVLSVMKVALLRVQSVFSGTQSNICFFTLTQKLDEMVQEIQTGEITHVNLGEKLTDLHSEFDSFKAGVMG